MDVGKSIGFVFEDESWVQKVLLGGVVSLIPIVDLAAAGYALRTLRNVAAGKERPLPDWSDFGDHFVQGILVFIGVLIYCAPMILLNGLAATARHFADSLVVGDLAATGIGVFACLQGLYGLLVGLWLPAAITNLATTGDLAAFFRFGEIWGLISRNAGDYVVVLLVSCGVSMVAALIGVVLCIIGLVFTFFIHSLIAAHMLGRLLHQSGRLVVAPAA